MPHWPVSRPVVPSVLSPWFSYPLDRAACSVSTNLSTGWTANRSIYLPIWLPESCTVTKLWWQNGLAAAGHVDCGIYDSEGNRLVSVGGATSQTGTSAIQSVDITDTVIPAGLTYFALSSDSNSTTFWCPAAGPQLIMLWSGYIQSGTFPLPNPAVFAEVTNGIVFPPKFGALVAPRTVL